jgi:hypothetical protein
MQAEMRVGDRGVVSQLSFTCRLKRKLAWRNERISTRKARGRKLSRSAACDFKMIASVPFGALIEMHMNAPLFREWLREYRQHVAVRGLLDYQCMLARVSTVWIRSDPMRWLRLASTHSAPACNGNVPPSSTESMGRLAACCEGCARAPKRCISSQHMI